MKDLFEQRYAADEQLLYALEHLREDFSGLDIVELQQLETEIHEGRYHTGLASVVRPVARR